MNLTDEAKQIRRKCLEKGIKCGQAHLGGTLSSVEILVSLFKKMKKEDKFIFSKGHCPLALYVILMNKKILKESDYGIPEVPGHLDHKTKGIEITTGSLGYGLGVAQGYALSKKLDNKKGKVYVLLGDTECTEGSIWESVMSCSSMKLNNLVAIVDNNKLGVLGPTKNYASLMDMKDKWIGFGWKVLTVDGHNFEEILDVLDFIELYQSNRPVVLIANTIKGKGISFLENQPRSHHGIPQGEELNQACRELGIK